MYIPTLDSPTRIIFSVSAYSSSGNTATTLFNDLRASPSQTQAVSSQPVSGIVIDIGDIKPDTLTVTNPPQGSYTVYITDTYISQNNYASIINGSNNKATGTGSGSSITLSWDSSVNKNEYRSYYVLIKAGEVVKYGRAAFANGIGSVDWNDMTEVSDNGGGNNGGTLSPDIDSSLLGTWKDKPVVEGYGTPGDILTVTFTGTTVTWGGSAGNALNTALSTYQAYGSYAWVVKNGNINLVYIHPSLGSQSYTCYTYIINGNGELELKVEGYTFATLVKQ
jgi:hypothetical protein